MFLAAIAIFEVGSAVCGATPGSVGLIVGRAVAGEFSFFFFFSRRFDLAWEFWVRDWWGWKILMDEWLLMSVSNRYWRRWDLQWVFYHYR